MKDRGFISADILFSLLILSLIGIIFIFIFNKSFVLQKKNEDRAMVNMKVENFIEDINFNKANIHMISLTNKSSINIKEDNINYIIEKTEIGGKLWKLNIWSSYKDSYSKDDRWVIIVEGI